MRQSLANVCRLRGLVKVTRKKKRDGSVAVKPVWVSLRFCSV